MKKIFYLFIFTTLIVACNNSVEKKSDEESTKDSLSVESDGLKKVDQVRVPIYRGEVIFTEEAAVMKGIDFIYGITMDTLARELAARVEPIKKDEFDMVKVVVSGIVSENPAVANGEEGWPEVLTIQNIISVSAQPSEADVKIEDNN